MWNEEWEEGFSPNAPLLNCAILCDDRHKELSYLRSIPFGMAFSVKDGKSFSLEACG